MPAQHTYAPIIPTLRYRDAAAAIEWLCAAFGFERHLVVPGEDGTIAHAQLTFANGMIILGSAREDEFGELQKTPGQVGGVGTQSPYVIVPGVDTHYARAVAMGAEIVMPLKDEDYGAAATRELRHVRPMGRAVTAARAAAHALLDADGGADGRTRAHRRRRLPSFARGTRKNADRVDSAKDRST